MPYLTINAQNRTVNVEKPEIQTLWYWKSDLIECAVYAYLFLQMKYSPLGKIVTLMPHKAKVSQN